MDDMSRREKAALRNQRQDLQDVLAKTTGRRFIRRLMDAAGLFNNEAGDYARGQRSLAIWLISEINEVDAHAFPRLLQEAVNDRVKAKVEPNEVD